MQPITISTSHLGPLQAIGLSGASNRMVTASQDRTMVWDLAARSAISTNLNAEPAPVLVRFSPDGSRFATFGDSMEVGLWGAASGMPIKPLVHGLEVLCLSFSPDSKFLATGSASGRIVLWDARSGERMSELTGHHDHVQALDFSPNGTTLASAGADGTTRTWDLETQEQMEVFHAHEGMALDLRFEDFGIRFIAADRSGKAYLVAPEEPSLLGEFSDQGDRAISCLSEDGRRMAIRGEKGSIGVLDARTGSHISTLVGHEHEIWKICFSPNSQFLASSDTDGLICLWSLPSGELMDRAVLDSTIDAMMLTKQVLAAGTRIGKIALFDIQGDLSQSIRRDN